MFELNNAVSFDVRSFLPSFLPSFNHSIRSFVRSHLNLLFTCSHGTECLKHFFFSCSDIRYTCGAFVFVAQAIKQLNIKFLKVSSLNIRSGHHVWFPGTGGKSHVVLPDAMGNWASISRLSMQFGKARGFIAGLHRHHCLFLFISR